MNFSQGPCRLSRQVLVRMPCLEAPPFGKHTPDRPQQGIDRRTQRRPLVFAHFIDGAPGLERAGCEALERRLIPVQDEEGAIADGPFQLALGGVDDDAASDDVARAVIALIVPPRQHPPYAARFRAHAILADEQPAVLAHAIDVGEELVPVGRQDRLGVIRQRQSDCGLPWIEIEQPGRDRVGNGAVVSQVCFPSPDLRGN